MRHVSFALSFWLLIAASSASAQPVQRELPSWMRGTWTPQTVVFGQHEATIRLPEGWSIREGGISTETGDCRIDFMPLQSSSFEPQLANELAKDRKASQYAMKSSLSRSTGSVTIVAVRYEDGPGQVVEKRYFELPAGDSSTLMAWMLTAQSTKGGNDCAKRFDLVAGSFRLRKAQPSQTTTF